MNSRSTNNGRTVSAFTLVELLVSMVVLMILMLAMMYVLNAVTTIDKRARARVDSFRESRAAFELITRRVSQAMLNTYWDYFDANNKSRIPTDTNFVAKTYGRQSELHFISGPSKLGTQPESKPLLPDVATNNLRSVTHGIFFQSPQGIATSSTGVNLPNLLNVSGYFIEYTTDVTDRPKFLRAGTPLPPTRWRFRLTEFNQGSEYLQVYRTTANPLSWFEEPLKSDPDTAPDIRSTRLLAENVIALIVLPHRSPNDPVPSGAPPQLAPNYFYDSRKYLDTGMQSDQLALLTRNQMPPMVQVTMVVIDERSAQRLQDLLGGTPENIQTATDLLALTSGATGLFLKPSTSGTETKEQFTADLKTLTDKLVSLKLTYRVFSTDVSILQAKWSE